MSTIKTTNIAHPSSASNNIVLGSSGQVGFNGANYGTSGQVLVSGGASAAPAWTTVSSSQWTTSGSDIYYTTGRVLVGTSSATANGGVLQVSNGVTFPAAQSACSDPNTLDDYEEGTWTPTIVFGSGSTGLTYSSRFGYYTKVGNVVTYNIAIALSNKGTSTGVARIGGWPFATTASNNANATGPARMSNMGTVSSTPFLVLSDGSSAFFAGLSTLTDTAFTNTSSIEMSITTAIV